VPSFCVGIYYRYGIAAVMKPVHARDEDDDARDEDDEAQSAWTEDTCAACSQSARVPFLQPAQRRISTLQTSDETWPSRLDSHAPYLSGGVEAKQASSDAH
jgi:hypothetical protein